MSFKRRSFTLPKNIKFFEARKTKNNFPFLRSPIPQTLREKTPVRIFEEERKAERQLMWIVFSFQACFSFFNLSNFLRRKMKKGFFVFLKEKHQKSFTIFLFVLKSTFVFWKLNKNTRVLFSDLLWSCKKETKEKIERKHTQMWGNKKRRICMCLFLDKNWNWKKKQKSQRPKQKSEIQIAFSNSFSKFCATSPWWKGEMVTTGPPWITDLFCFLWCQLKVQYLELYPITLNWPFVFKFVLFFIFFKEWYGFFVSLLLTVSFACAKQSWEGFAWNLTLPSISADDLITSSFFVFHDALGLFLNQNFSFYFFWKKRGGGYMFFIFQQISNR